MLRLTYTEEMKKQDELWEEEKEDTHVMEKLYHDIVTEAKDKGFDGIVDIYQGSGEAIADVYSSQEEMNLVLESGRETTCYGNCRSLIKHLEERINKLDLLKYFEGNPDLFDPSGLSEDMLYNEFLGFIERAYYSNSGFSVERVSDSLEDLVDYVVEDNKLEVVNKETIYELFVDNDYYIYRINKTGKFILFKQ